MDDDQPPKVPTLESAKGLMAHGPHVLYDFMAAKIETALGRAMPQMEIRVNNLSLSAEITVADNTNEDGKTELPTLANVLKKAFVTGKNHSAHKEIIKNVSVVLKPGTMTLVLGQPGSGKSSLMKVLSGRFPMAKNIKREGQITYNGKDIDSIQNKLPQFAAYVDQRDKHYPTLTVKETLEFAHLCSGGELLERGEELLSKGTSEENKAALEATRAMFQHYPDIIIQQLGLEICQNTIVGDAMLRGVSGGERKRVTTGEMEFGMKYATFMDEISTGLDSAATYDIINTQRSIAKMLRKTVVIALLQPSPEVLSLFDDVLIMNEGEVVYHGPCDQVVDYFEGLGFTCPPERDLADYLLDLGTSEQHRYQVALPSTSSLTKHPRSAGEFAELYRRSPVYEEIMRALEAPLDPILLENANNHMDKMPEYHLAFIRSLLALIRRETLVIFRNIPFLRGRTMMIVVNGFLYATTFYQFDPTDIQVVLGVLFASIMFLSMGQASQIPTYMAARDVFYKQRRANFFRTAEYVFASSLSRLPTAIFETLLFGNIVYWTCGFDATAASFLKYLMIVFLSNMAFTSWFFFIGCIAPNVNVGSPLSMLSVLVMILFGGFIVTKNTIPDYFIWLYWISPLGWAFRALAVNQYRSATFDVCNYNGVDYCAKTNMTMGEYYLSLFGIPSEKYWAWYGMVTLVILYFFFMFLAFLVLEYKRYESPENVVIGKKDIEDGEKYMLAETPKSNANSPLEDFTTMEVDSGEKNFVPVTIAFQNLWYSVPDPSNPKESIDLLKGITGYARPGSMTALMGSSGAGKTTLMDVIAGRKTEGQIRGKILLNGYEATDLAIRRCTGYCEQMDIHSEAATIREALTFSAFLRQDSSVPDSKKYDSVNECLELLGMEDIADQIIRGSSVEQMKRLTIGVELAAQPSIIFLDEPTSGLDARSAKKIMNGVRKVANTGRTIVCTIHQPSSEVFLLFDHLLLLKRGGETVFFGELGVNASSLVEYFEAIPGVDPLPPVYNPAAWMLEAIGAGVGHGSSNETDFVRFFNESALKQQMDRDMSAEGVSHPSPKLPEMTFSDKRAASGFTQMSFVIHRFFRMYWRTASYSLTRPIISLVLALLFGVVFAGSDYNNYEGVQSGAGVLFISTLFNGMVSLMNVIPMSIDDRGSYYRERASQTYNALWYFLGSTLVEIPYVFFGGLLFTVIFFPMVGFTGFWAGVQFWIALSLIVLILTYMGMFLAFALPSTEVATIISVFINTVFITFTGFNPPADAIPSGYKWLYTITPQRYALSIMASVVFCDCSEEPTWDETQNAFVNGGSELGCRELRNAPVTVGHITVKNYVERVFRFKHDEIARNFGVLVLFIAFFRVLGLLALRFVNHQKR